MKAAACFACACVLIACIGQTPEDQERDAVVSIGPHGPEHNPGSPCLLCHDFGLAGTIYRRAADENGVAGVTVTMTDATGRVFTEVSNATGNFYTNDAPTYPVHVEISMGGVKQPMRNVVHQWGSCAECHRPDAGASSAGRIFLEKTP
ncbi:MAG TPA: hypothetical protein VL463_09220 [Kofleriaceae bacterium]|nr:hypothetical protein [Kofleriaceae bacterium]